MRLKLALCLLATPGWAGPAFEPVSIAEHQYVGGWEHFVGGGVATFDCNGDHLPELFVAGGEAPAVLYENRSERGAAVVLTPNTPDDLAFIGTTGAYPIDIDADGLTDLVILSTGQNAVMRGLGACQFEPFDLGFLPDERWTTAFSAAWGPDDVLPTLAFGNYVDRTDPEGPFEACDAGTLYRPDGARYAVAQDIAPGYCALSVLFSDWSRSGQPDLRLSNDRHYYVREGHEQLFHVFPQLEAVGAPWINHNLWGMGIASRDVTGDGWPEVYLSSMGDQRLQEMTPGLPEWRDAPFDWGTTSQRPHTGGDGRPSTGWHTAFGDVQNDGLEDIFVAKGNVDQMPGLALEDPNSLMIGVGPLRWKEASVEAGVASLHRGRGAALVDLNLDGLLDLAVVNRRAPFEVWENVTKDTGAFLSVRLQQVGGNRDAIGAWIEVDAGGRVMAREVTIGGGHASGALVGEHFGLGSLDQAKLRIIWPDQTTSDWVEVALNQFITVIRDGSGLVVSRQ